MSFANPLLLLGLLGAAVPVLIHLFGRRRPPVVPFPSVRLLKATQQRQRAFARLKNLIVLLLRVLAVAFVALALAGPRAQSALLSAAFGGPAHSVAVVRDDSFSMSARAGGHAPAERAAGVLERIRSAGGDPGFLELRTSDPFGTAALGAGVSQTAKTLPPAIESAVQALTASAGLQPRVLVLTDMQAAAWRGAEGLAALAADGDWLTVVDCGGEAPANWAIADLAPVTTPVVAGMPARLRARVDRFGGDEPQRVAVSMAIDGEVVEAKTVVVAAGASRFTEFAHTFPEPRAYAVRVSLTGEAADGPEQEGWDGPLLDDVRCAVVEAGPPLDVVCVGEPGRLRFVTTALRPPGAASPVAPRLVAPVDLTWQSVATADGIVLGDVPRLGEEALEALRPTARAERDGPRAGVLVFLGESVDTGFYTESLLRRLLPGAEIALGPPASTSGAMCALAEIVTERGPLALFGEPRTGDLSRFRFRRFRPLDLSGEAEVLARFDNGVPAIVAGRGDPPVILVNTTPDDAWTDAPHHAAFVPLLHQLAHALALRRRPPPRAAIAGEPFEPPARIGRAIAPGGGPAVSRQELASRGPQAAGIYRATGEGEGGEPAFAVNVDAAESDLTRLSREQLRRIVGGHARVIGADDASGVAALVGAPVADLSALFLLLAVTCLCGELWLSLRRKSPPRADHTGSPVSAPG